MTGILSLRRDTSGHCPLTLIQRMLHQCIPVEVYIPASAVPSGYWARIIQIVPEIGNEPAPGPGFRYLLDTNAVAYKVRDDSALRCRIVPGLTLKGNRNDQWTSPFPVLPR
jgi:hypothetical protein